MTTPVYVVLEENWLLVQEAVHSAPVPRPILSDLNITFRLDSVVINGFLLLQYLYKEKKIVTVQSYTGLLLVIL